MKAKLYTKPTCPFCIRAKEILAAHDIVFEDFDVSNNQALRDEVSASVGGYRTVPMIFLDDEFVGGCSELQALEKSGSLGAGNAKVSDFPDGMACPLPTKKD